MQPAKYKVSTITATGSLGTELDLDEMYAALDAELVGSDPGMYLTYIEYGTRKTCTIYKGTCRRVEPGRRCRPRARRFDNQVTLIVSVVTPTFTHVVNSKCFRNGNVQMTGLRHIDEGVRVIDFIAAKIRGVATPPSICADPGKLAASAFRVRLINSDFRIGFNVRREVLNRIVQFEYGVFATYEPCIYPGVKIQYFWNGALDPAARSGRCACAQMCSGKGTSDKTGFCKKVTISVFQSGCVIVTGAQSYEQVDDACAFLTRVVHDNEARVRQPDVPVPA